MKEATLAIVAVAAMLVLLGRLDHEPDDGWTVLEFWSYGTGDADTEWPWPMAASPISTLPVLVLFISCQHFFVNRLTRGALKA